MSEVFKHEMLLDNDGLGQAGFGLPMHWLHVYNNAPGHTVPNHWHEELEISFVVGGSLTGFTVNDETFDAHKGEMVIIRPGDAHKVADQAPDSERDILVVFFDAQILLQNIPNLKQLHFYSRPEQVNAAEAEKLQADLMTLYRYIMEPVDELTQQLLLKRIMYDVLYRLVNSFSYYVEGDDSELLTELGVASDMMQDIVTYIKANIQEDIRVQDVAREFKLSDSYLTRCFKRYLDCTPMAYIQMIRLNSATQYLMNTDYAMQYIADLSGFGSLRSFERAFKERYNATPTVYRRTHRMEND